MKKVKVLVVSLLLFLTAGSIYAQNDSIYGLEASIEDYVLNLSFHSTYNMSDLETVIINFYDKNSNEHIGTTTIYYIDGNFYSKFGEAFSEKLDNSTKISVVNGDLYHYYGGDESYLSRQFKIELYIEGEGYSTVVYGAPKIKTQSIGRSNVLTYYFNPTTTSINKITNNENYTYKYYLLSGIESTTKPLGVPFIEMIYDNGVLIGKNKHLIRK